MRESMEERVVTTMGHARDDLPTAARPEVRLMVTLRDRGGGVLDQNIDAPPADPSLEQVLEVVPGLPEAISWVLLGGEPTLRSDLPALVKGLVEAGAPRLVLATDGLVLTTERIVRNLKVAGINAVRLRFHSHHLDAHDWLVGRKGAGKRVVKAIRTCVSAGMPVEVEATVTRVTRPYLVETVEVLARLGVGGLCLRRPVAQGRCEAEFLKVSPRFGLTQPTLEAAVAAGIRAGVRVTVEGFPRCACPAASAQRLQRGSVRWAAPEAPGWERAAALFAYPEGSASCQTCPGPPECAGGPPDYIARFGMMEVGSEGNRQIKIGDLAPTPLAGGEVTPPPRSGRFPATRVRYVSRAAARPSLMGDPLVGIKPAPPPDTLRMIFAAPSRVRAEFDDHLGPVEPETTRDARVRLVQAAQHGARRLRVASSGSLAHPNAPELLRETTRLAFRALEVAGEGSALNEASDMQLRRLRGIHRLDLVLFAPEPDAHDAHLTVPGGFEATMSLVDRLGRLTPTMKVGCYGLLSGAEALEAWAEAWEMGDLPGDPAFRLAHRGGSLAGLAQAVASLEQADGREALVPLLPPCLIPRDSRVLPARQAGVAWGDQSTSWRSPSNIDLLGCYNPCSFAADCSQARACPGLAVGWSTENVAPVNLSNPE